MKNYILLTIFSIILSSVAFGQSTVEGVLRKYRNDDNVTSIMYEGDNLKKYLKQNENIKSSVEFIDVMVFKKDTGISTKDKAKINTLLQTQAYETLIDVKSKEGKAKVMGISSADKLTNVYIELKAEDMSIYAMLKGSVLLAELSKIASSVNFEELSALKILDK
ncbi:MAG: DUF4252 domain-containing protein [Saprospiraceae bacterium]|nr:DUF4252 domain-containing protein [Saprospiraceae bacterium]